MAIVEFRELYFRLCDEYHVEPDEAIVEELRSKQVESALSNQLESSSSAPAQCLQLSRVSISPRQAALLGQCLSVDARCFSEVLLDDCALSEEAARAIAHAMATNTACTLLDLKGNNIRGSAVEALGRMLKENRTLKTLTLEWNGLGLVDSSFALFCEGLASNPSLETLDLRNNQITHDHANHLARALRSNSMLIRLDLRWNSLGLLGGRALLAAFEENHGLCRLELTGNDLPPDLARAIGHACARNAERRELEEAHRSHAMLLNQAIDELRREKGQQMVDLMSRFDGQEEELRRTSQAAALMLKDLQAKLDERKAALTNLNGRVALLESQLELANAKIVDLEGQLARAAQERQEADISKANELGKEREARFSLEQRLSRELKDANARIAELEARLAESDRRLRLAQEAQIAAKEELAQVQLDSRTKLNQADERLLYERQKSKEQEHDAMVAKEKELSLIRAELEQTEQLYKEKVRKLEADRAQGEQELARLRNQTLQDRLVLEDQLLAVRQRSKAEEEQRVMQLEERLRNLQANKDELAAQYSLQGNMHTEAQSRAHQLSLECETLKRRIDDLIQQLGNKNQEIAAEVAKVKLEFQHKIQRLESERLSIQELHDRISQLERELLEEKSKGRQRQAELEAEVRNALERAAYREREMAAWRSEEQKRTTFLQHAFIQYLGTSPGGVTLSASAGPDPFAATATLPPGHTSDPRSGLGSSLPPLKSK